MPEPDHAPDLDVTVRVAAPTPSTRNDQPDIPQPEDLAKMLPGENYTVEGFLGAGGMGAVYKGTQVRLQRKVAIKIMRRDRAKDQGFEERFRREALAMAQLNHPNIVNVIDYGEAGPDYLYIVMEFIDGTDLVNVIRSGQMTQETALKLLPQICDALQFAHDNGIVHRDIKPANILLTRDGRIKMADFGLAKRFDAENSYRTQSGYGMGTPDYAAPEQFMGDAHVDHRADIYALGVMIYQMVTGTLPRGAWKPPSEKAAVDTYWDHIVARALQTDPHDRYASVSEIKTDLGGITTVTGGPRPTLDGTQSLQTAGMTAAKGSTTALTQAGGRPASKLRLLAAPDDAPHTKSSRFPFVIAASVILLAVGGWFGWFGWFGWQKFSPANAASTSATGTLTIRSITPPSPARLKVGEKMKVEIEFLNPGARVVQIWAYPYKYGTLSNLVISSGSFPTDKQSGTLERWFSFKEAGEADELRVEMVADAENLSSREVIAKIAVPLSAVWTSAGMLPADSAPLTDITATKDTPFVNSLGMMFVPIPGTRVLMCIHETRKKDFAAFAAANPVINSTSWQNPKLNELVVSDGLDHPVVNVNSYDAESFCQWLEKTEGLKYRLPTDREWSVAVGIGDLEDPGEHPRNLELNSRTQHIYPWGEAWPPPAGSANLGDNAAAAVMRFQSISNIGAYDDGFATTAPVMKFQPSPLGLYDMVGNVEEWVSDWWDDQQRMRVLRGTSFLDNWSGNSHSSKRRSSAPGAFYARCGFRCVIELNQSVAKPEPSAKPENATLRPGNAVTLSPAGTPPANQTSSFPPGVWVKIDTLPKTELTTEGWFQTDPHMIYGTVEVPGLKGVNHAIRARFRSNAPQGAVAAPPVKLIARNSLTENYHVYLTRSMDRLFVRHEVLKQRGIMPPLASGDLPGQPAPEDEFTLEFAAVGKSLLARSRGVWIKGQIEPESAPKEGRAALFVSNTDLFRDVEVMNLDGLSEAQALKLLESEASSPKSGSPIPPSSVAAATKEAPFTNSLGMKFVPVPITGGPTDGKRVLFSIWETQVQDYEVFAKETKRMWTKPPFDQGPTHPAVNVNWADAVAFCNWLTERERTAGRLGVQEVYRLPSDHEWSCAAGIGGREDAASPLHQKSQNLTDAFLWGNEWPPPPGSGNFHGEEMAGNLFFQTQGILNGYWDGFVRTAPAGTFPPNSLGIFDLSGNVSEYCEDWYDATQKSRVARGASWGKNLRNELPLAFRDKHPPNFQNIILGFRCVIAPAP